MDSQAVANVTNEAPDQPSAVDVLNELLALEQRRLAVRLIESGVFISQLSVVEGIELRRIAAESRTHCACLVDAIAARDGTPGPRVGDLRSADLHYQELRHVWPRLVADHEALVRRYRAAVDRLSPAPDAAAIIARILARHEADLQTLHHLSNGAPADSRS